MFEILPKTQADIKEYLHRIASKHADRSQGFLVPLPIDQETYPGQSLFDPIITSKSVLPPNEADTIASGIDKRYPDLMRAYDDYTRLGSGTSDRFLQVQPAVMAGTNVVNGTDHAELVDIIFNHLHFTNRLRRSLQARAEQLDDKPEKHQLRGGIVVSKMVDFLGVKLGDNVTPVRELLAWGFDRTYLTIPPKKDVTPTERIAIKRYNSHVRAKIVNDMEPRAFSNRRPMVLGVALPGTVNKAMQTNPEIMVVGKVSDGVLDFVRHALLVVSAVRMREHGSTIFIDDFLGNPYGVEGETPSEALKSHIGRLVLGIELLDHKPYIYDEGGSIPVIEPSSFTVE